MLRRYTVLSYSTSKLRSYVDYCDAADPEAAARYVREIRGWAHSTIVGVFAGHHDILYGVHK